MCKYAVMIEDPKDIRYALEKAYHLAMTGRRGPSWIDIPVNYQGCYIETDELPRTPAQWLEAVMNAIFFLCGILAVGCVAVITIYMFLSGLPAIGKIGPLKFLFGTEWASTASEPKYGILPFVLSSIYGTLGASLIGVPVGLLTAVFLSKAAAPGVRNVVVTAVELLSGIPSVVFGLLGMQVLVPAVAKVFGKASGACLLSAIEIGRAHV